MFLKTCHPAHVSSTFYWASLAAWVPPHVGTLCRPLSCREAYSTAWELRDLQAAWRPANLFFLETPSVKVFGKMQMGTSNHKYQFSVLFIVLKYRVMPHSPSIWDSRCQVHQPTPAPYNRYVTEAYTTNVLSAHLHLESTFRVLVDESVLGVIWDHCLPQCWPCGHVQKTLKKVLSSEASAGSSNHVLNFCLVIYYKAARRNTCCTVQRSILQYMQFISI